MDPSAPSTNPTKPATIPTTQLIPGASDGLRSNGTFKSNANPAPKMQPRGAPTKQASNSARLFNTCVANGALPALRPRAFEQKKALATLNGTGGSALKRACIKPGRASSRLSSSRPSIPDPGRRSVGARGGLRDATVFRRGGERCSDRTRRGTTNRGGKRNFSAKRSTAGGVNDTTRDTTLQNQIAFQFRQVAQASPL